MASKILSIHVVKGTETSMPPNRQETHSNGKTLGKLDQVWVSRLCKHGAPSSSKGQGENNGIWKGGMRIFSMT